jgi:hypothetical protein
MQIGRVGRVATKLWWLFVDEKKNVLNFSHASVRITYSYRGSYGPVSEEDIKGIIFVYYWIIKNFVYFLVCLNLVLEHLGCWVKERILGNERYIKRLAEFNITELMALLKPMENMYLYD